MANIGQVCGRPLFDNLDLPPLKFSSRVLDFSIFISRQNKLVCAQMASKKITRFVPLRVHFLEIRRLGSWNTLPRQRSVIFFFPVVSSHDICLLFAVRMHCISVDFTSCGLLLMKEECRICFVRL